MTPPVIIVGMHRSGTSLLVESLESLGLFAGARKEDHDEALFFLGLNNWIFKQANCGWDNPEPVLALSDAPELLDLVSDYLDQQLRSIGSLSFLGIGGAIRWRGIRHISQPWGWKDPRNTVTLPLWLQLFPDARVLNISRHGVDVANSLVVRHRASMEFARQRYRRLRWLHYWVPKKGRFAESPATRTLEGGFALWEKYVSYAQDQSRNLGDRALTIQYEEFLKEPEEVLRRACQFCGLSPSPSRLGQSCARVNESRAFAFRKDPVLSGFAETVGDRLAAFEYSSAGFRNE